MNNGINPAAEIIAIELLLKERIGLEASSLGSGAVEHAVRERLPLSGAADTADYLELLSKMPAELEALIELVVVPETWFFRDSRPFAFLAEHILSGWKPARPGATLRILSAPCATGEEPYSIAMTCLDCGLGNKQFIVDAIDINDKFLDRARAAAYGRHSFRGARTAFRDRYFSQEGDAFLLKPEVKAAVRFSKANLLDQCLPFPCASYNVIFCRNLMIYFHAGARVQIIKAIDRLLARDGVFFVGHAEITPALTETFEACGDSGAFAFRKRKPGAATAGRPAHAPQTAVARHTARPAPGTTATAAPAREEACLPAPSRRPGLEAAMRLADSGRLQEAEQICQRELKANAGNARAHFLMGLIREAGGDNAGAETSFNRAIYLDSDFGEAILHLAALKEQNGESAAAGLLRRRAAALESRLP